MTIISITGLDDSYYELRQEFQKLALLVPTIPKDRYLSEIEFIELVIGYIRLLQQVLLYEQSNGYLDDLTLSMSNNSIISSSSCLSSSYLNKQIKVQSSKIQRNETVPIISRSPLISINLDNTPLF